jgi:hypothetical protein
MEYVPEEQTPQSLPAMKSDKQATVRKGSHVNSISKAQGDVCLTRIIFYRVTS